MARKHSGGVSRAWRPNQGRALRYSNYPVHQPKTAKPLKNRQKPHFNPLRIENSAHSR